MNERLLKNNYLFSTGRTGTVFLAQALSALPGISARHEARAKAFKFWQTATLNGSSPPAPFRLLLRWCLAHRAGEKEKCHFELNPPCKGHLKQLAELRPDAFYGLLVRHPASYVNSAVNWSIDKPLNRVAKLYLPLWEVRPAKYRLGRSYYDRLFEIAVCNWKKVNSACLELQEMGVNFKVLYYEDFIADPAEFIGNLLKESGFAGEFDEYTISRAVDDAPRNQSRPGRIRTEEWEDKYKKYLEEEIGGLAGELGYTL